MANPLSDRGVSDRDYAAAVGTLVGEVAARSKDIRDYQAIADVIANRLDDGYFSERYGKNIAAQVMNPSEFSTWSPKERNAFANAKAGFAAALDPSVVDKFSPAMQEKIGLAKQAVEDVMVTGVARGITQGATFYDNPEVTAKLGTGAFHNRLDDKYGSIVIGDHRYTGQNLRLDQPFDPITYNGQLAAPPSVDPFLGDIGVPVGQVTALGPVPDLTPQQPASAGSFFGGFDIGDVTLPGDAYADIGAGLRDFETDQALTDMRMSAYDRGFYGQQPLDDMPDIMGQFDQGTYPDITAGTAFDPLGNISPVDYGPMPDVMSQFDQGTYPDISQGLYNEAPTVGVGQPAQYGEEQAFGSYTPAAPSNFSAGLNEGPWGATPDFDAPSLAARNNVDKFDGAMAVRNQSTPTNEDIAASVMAELAPSAPQLSTASFDPQAAAMGDWADKFGAPTMSTPSVSTQAAPTRTAGPTSTSPQGDFAAPERVSRSPSLSAPTPPSRPAEATPSLPSTTAPSFTDTVLDGLGLSAPINSVKSGLSDVFGSSTNFVDAMSNPQIAENYTPGLFDGWTGDVITGAAMGALTGGPFGALTGGLFGGLNIGGRVGSHLSNSNGGIFSQGFGGFLDTMANPFNGMSPEDIAAYGLDGDWTTREPTRNTGFGPSGSRGDGSYSDHAGYSDNNPQGIL